MSSTISSSAVQGVSHRAASLSPKKQPNPQQNAQTRHPLQAPDGDQLILSTAVTGAGSNPEPKSVKAPQAAGKEKDEAGSAEGGSQQKALNWESQAKAILRNTADMDYC